MEITTGVERRRRWPLEDKFRMLAELDDPGMSVPRSRGGMRSAAGCYTTGVGNSGRAR
jgi:hypothetical protein